MLLAACCLASVGHLDAVQPNRPSGDYTVYKDRVLREVRERIRSPISATSNETIGALACLLSFEMSRGSGEALTHLQGLKSIIDENGGMDESLLGGITMMLETLDLLHAALFDAEPVLTTRDVLEPLVQSDLSDAQTFVHLTPLVIAEQEDFHKKNTLYREHLQQLPELLRNAFNLLDGVLKEGVNLNISLVPTDSIEHFEKCIEHFGQLASLNFNHSPDASNLIRTCHLNLVIISNLVRYRMPHRHKINQKYADGLYSAFRSVSDQAWEHLWYLRLWM